jgi:septal ring factor EnvC (AmiA/AmiB activator)
LGLIDLQKFYKIATIRGNQGIAPTGLTKSLSPFNKEEMAKQIERQIRDLQRELAEIQKEQSSLRLQPCKGDAEIRTKEGKLEDLDKRARSLRETIRELERKNQERMSEPFKKEEYESPFL